MVGQEQEQRQEQPQPQPQPQPQRQLQGSFASLEDDEVWVGGGGWVRFARAFPQRLKPRYLPELTAGLKSRPFKTSMAGLKSRPFKAKTYAEVSQMTHAWAFRKMQRFPNRKAEGIRGGTFGGFTGGWVGLGTYT